ncbi:hypothetical protein SAMN04488134_102129 [Amphibacillus marinus]|uniref:Uncharacterized protein n=1 Tax=Amphibacillus marinus TaxID=872970 RepID=A0A1H8K0F5_9BACI|nr:hypothetical protein [Amphibacillus marinus]SEN86494.1 hypothetical protein SAMN04488134_102129 [Amphibacillus marinus]
MALRNEEYLRLISNNETRKERKEIHNDNIKIRNGLENLLNYSRSLYWTILEEKEAGNPVNNEFIGLLEKSLEYNQLSGMEIKKEGKHNKEMVLPKSFLHRILYPNNKVGVKMRSFLLGFPLLSLNEMKKNWNDFLESPGIRLFFTIFFSSISSLIGGFTAINYTIIVTTSIHFCLRIASNRVENNDYISFQRSLQLFIWPYVLLALGNALNGIISFNGLPEGIFLTVLSLWIVWGELKGVVEKAELCSLPVPGILKKLVNSKDDGGFPPL